MTRKDYQLIAKALLMGRPAVIPGTNAIIDDTARTVWHNVVTNLSLALAKENPAFNATRFFDAAGVAS